MRLFIALEVPTLAREVIDRSVAPMREQYRGLRWTRSTGWHLTVAFLGEVDVEPEAVIAAVAPAVQSCAPIGLRIGSAGRFGGRVLWLGIEDEPIGAVAEVGAAVQAALAAAGLPVDDKAVVPHLTLARAGEKNVRPLHVGHVPKIEGEWLAAELVLYRSHLAGRKPARYEQLRTIPLG